MMRQLLTTWRSFPIFACAAAVVLLDVRALFGADEETGSGGGGPSEALSWGLILLCLVLGLLVTLRSPHRAAEVKRPVRDDD